MKYRVFGKTGLEVSELVFGGGAVGGLLIDQDDQTKLQAVTRALHAGINWIDTAASYGQGKSEEALGWILKEVEQAPYVSTKFNLDTADLNDIPGQIQRSLTGSLERLQRSSVTLLQLHNPIGPQTDGRTIGFTEVLKPRGVLEALEHVQGQGLIDHYGITALGHTPSIIEVLKSGSVASAQVYFNLLNPSAASKPPPSWPCYSFAGILDACAEHGVAAMNIRVFSAGVIATDERHGRERPLTPGDTVASETAKASALFQSIGATFGSRAQTAIRFALSQSRLTCVVFGLAELEHLDEALEAQRMGPLPADAMAEIRHVYDAPLLGI